MRKNIDITGVTISAEGDIDENDGIGEDEVLVEGHMLFMLDNEHEKYMPATVVLKDATLITLGEALNKCAFDQAQTIFGLTITKYIKYDRYTYIKFDVSEDDDDE